MRPFPARAALALELTGVAALVAAQTLLARRLLHTDTFFDEGTYLVSVDALRHGQELGDPVFTSQPPGWYHLLDLVVSIAGSSVADVRGGLAVVAGLGAAAAYGVGRAIAGRLEGALCAGMLLIAFPLALYAGRVLADPASLTLALTAVALAALAGRTGRATLAAACGLVLMVGVLVKLQAVLALPTVGCLLLLRQGSRRRLVGAFAAGAAAPLALVAAVHARALPDLWDGAVTYHRRAAGVEILDNGAALRSLFNPRMPFGWLVVLGAAGAVVAVARRGWSPAAALWLWPAVVASFLFWHDPLLEHHLASVTVALAPAAGVALAFGLRALPRRAAAVAAAVLVTAIGAGYAQEIRRLDSEVVPEEPGTVWAAQELARATAPGELVASDQPYAAYLARRRVAGELVDTAQLRFSAGSLTPESVLRILEDRCVRAVVAGRSFTTVPGVLERLRARYPDETRRFGVSVLTRPRC